MLRLFTSAFKWPTLRLPKPAALKRFTNRFLIAGFVLALALPMIGVVFGRAATLTAENRGTAPPPQWNHDFNKQFDAYYADRTGGRRALLRMRNRILLDAFHESPTPKVLLGTDDWLYLNTGFDPLDPHGDVSYGLDEVATTLRNRSQWCRERGILYMVQVAREKHHVHPEHLPNHLQRYPADDAVPRLQTLCPEVTILDPLPVLRAEAREGQVYYRQDSHWNTRGVVVGYRQMAAELERAIPGYRGKVRSDFTPVPEWKAVSDLALILGLPAKRTGEPTTWYHQPAEVIADHPTVELQALTEVVRLTHLPPQSRSCKVPNTVHLLLLHDSFGMTFRDYLAGDVAQFTALGTYGFPRHWIEKHKPTVVIQQFVERAMLKSSLAMRE